MKAYQQNQVDVKSFLEDSQAMKVYKKETKMLDEKLLSVEIQLKNKQAVYSAQYGELKSQIVNLQDKLSKSEQQLALHKNEVEVLQSLLEKRRSSPLQNNQTFKQPDHEKVQPMGQERPKAVQITQNAGASSAAPTPPPPPPPPPSLPPLPPPPPPPPFSTSSGTNSATRKLKDLQTRQPYQTLYKLPTINWTVIQNQQSRDTIFAGMNDEKIIENLDLVHFEDLFKLTNEHFKDKLLANEDVAASTYVKNPLKLVRTKQPKKCLVNDNRNRCLGILLCYLKSVYHDLNKLWKDIKRLEVNQDIADRILHQLPTQDEIKLYENYEVTQNLPVDDLTEEDQLLLQLCKIERLGPKLEIVIFMSSFNVTINTIQTKLSAVNSACENIRNSKKFAKVLELILAFGNYISSYRCGIAYGFKLKSLATLSEIKTMNKQMTLLHFIVNTIEKEFPDLANFYDELDGVIASSKVPIEVMTSEVTGIVTMMIKSERESLVSIPRTPKRLLYFVKENKPIVSDLQQSVETVFSVFAQTTKWFGEVQNGLSPEQFFGYIALFILQFKKAQMDNEKVRIAEAAKLRAISGIHARNDVDPPKVDQNSHKVTERLPVKDRVVGQHLKNKIRTINANGMMDDILSELRKTAQI